MCRFHTSGGASSQDCLLQVLEEAICTSYLTLGTVYSGSLKELSGDQQGLNDRETIGLVEIIQEKYTVF